MYYSIADCILAKSSYIFRQLLVRLGVQVLLAFG